MKKILVGAIVLLVGATAVWLAFDDELQGVQHEDGSVGSIKPGSRSLDLYDALKK
ncbi:MAG: hypothetical protein ACR2HJ_08880 [Fimbriimonadales bacterium]